MRQKIKKASFYGFWLLKFSSLMVVFLMVSLPLRFSKKYKDLWIIRKVISTTWKRLRRT